jgi:hypothetical protein
MQPIDKLIDSALQSETTRDVPAGFHDHVMERIAAEALQSAQAADRTHRFVRPALFMTVLAAAIIVVPMVSFYGQWTRQALPGGLGLLDYAIAWIDLSRMGSFTDFTLAAASALGAGAALMGAGWAVIRLRGGRQQTDR